MTGRRAFLKIVAVVLLVGLVVAPVVAGRTVGSGDTIYAGEEDLNFVGFGTLAVNQTAGRLVHYTDYAAGVWDKVIYITNPADFELTESDVGTTTGSYYVFPSGAWDLHPENAAGSIYIDIPKVRLDVVLSNSRLDSVDGKSVTHDNKLDFKLANNLVGLPGATMNIEVTLPGGGVTTQFGSQTLKLVPADGTTVYKGTIDLMNAKVGTYNAMAKWPSDSDFYGKGFDSNCVMFEVIAPKAIPATGFLYVSSTPSGASIYVDGIYKGVTPLEYSEISAGSHQVKITRSGYYDHTQTTSVTVGKTTPVSATLLSIPPTSNDILPIPTTGSLDVRSSPSGASIYIDGVYKGVTPKVISGLSAGSHQAKVTKSGYNDYTRTTSVTAGKTTPVSATLSSIPRAPVTGSLDVRSTPSGASIYIDGDYKGVTPKVISGLSEGSHQVKVTRSGYNDYTRTTSVTAGKTATVSATLSPIPQAPVTGSLDVSSTPSGANIYIDGEYKGVTPMVISGLPEGEYLVTVTKDGYFEDFRYVVISPGGTSSVSPTLSSHATAIPEYSTSGSSTEGISPIIWLLLVFAVILPAGYLVHSRKRRLSTQKSETDGAGPLKSPAVHDAGHTPRRQNTGMPPGKADTSRQKTKTPPPKKPDRAAVLPDGGSAESTAKPDISITLGHATIHADEWDKIGLTLVNTGTAPAFDITLTFSNDVDTRLLRPVDLAAGENITIDAGIKPRAKGKIPLEITARYRDAGNRTYEQTTSCWLSVVSRNDSPGSPLPSSIPHPMTPKSLPPEMAERYTASEFIGRGGFARVFKVQKPDGSWAALKIPISLDAATGKSFIAELQNWTSMVHENIVRVQDYNIMPLPYFELELCDGTLAELEKPVPPDHAAWLLFNVCEGLKYAHARGILHRDLKPQNIMLRDGVPKISDWGLSKVMTQSRTTTVSGGFTAYYAAPEQIANRVKGPRTDIWQLGVILYELVTGKLPFTGESMVEIGMAIVTKTPERPGAVHSGAQPLDAIILRCLEKQPRQRYRSVADLQSDLAAYLKLNYAESLKESIQVHDLHRSAYYCGDLVLISMKTGNLVDAYKYAADLARYSAGEARAQAIGLAKQIKMRVEMGAQELPDELIRKAEVIVHQVRVR
jgi:hypothetical protein